MTTNYILIKTDGHSSDGFRLTSFECCQRLLDYGAWPLWERTAHRKRIKKGDRVLIYAGCKTKGVVGAATVESVEIWDKRSAHNYPLVLDNIPASLIRFTNVSKFDEPAYIKEHLDQLDLCPENKSRWGVMMMGGVKTVTDNDYKVLTMQMSNRIP